MLPSPASPPTSSCPPPPQVHDVYMHLPGCGGNPEAAPKEPSPVALPDGTFPFAPSPASPFHHPHNYSSSGTSLDRYYAPVYPPQAPPVGGSFHGGFLQEGYIPPAAIGHSLGATGGAAEYWQQQQQYYRSPPGPSPLIYSPSFNADQARLTDEMARGMQGTGEDPAG